MFQGRHVSAMFPHRPGFLGGSEIVLRLAWEGGRKGRTLRPPWLGRVRDKGSSGGEAFFLVRGWWLLAKEQKYHQI